jgi:hypothetical protein
MDALLTEDEMAQKLKTTPRTVRDWRNRRLIPFFKIARSIRYDERRVVEALRKLERNSEAV